jgi:hypothetical protein
VLRINGQGTFKAIEMADSTQAKVTDTVVITAGIPGPVLKLFCENSLKGMLIRLSRRKWKT